MNIFRRKQWSPYVAGACVGILLCLSAVLTGKFIGASTTFVRAAGMIEKLFEPEHVQRNLYFMRNKVQVDWQWMLVVGIFFGSLLASKISADYKLTAVPPMWQNRFGKSAVKRWAAAFIGGSIMIFGARMAGGCPSGHGLSGLAQLSVSGYIALICFFTAGILVARIIYSGGAR